MGSKRLIPIAAGALLLLVLGNAGLWFWSAGKLETGVALWTEKQRRHGYRITYEGPEIGGFPARLEAVFEAPRVASPKGWVWQGPRVTGHARILSPTVIEADFPGRHLIAIDAPGVGLRAEVTAASAIGLVDLDAEGQVERAEAELVGVAVASPTLGSLLVSRAAAAFGPWQAGGGRAPTLALAGRAAGVTLPEAAINPLGRELQAVELEATLHEIVPPENPRAALTRWRDAGGKLDLHRLKLVWGPMTLEGDGTLSLDRELRPLGALTARMKGLEATLDALVEAGLVERRHAMAARFALLALAGGSGGPDAPDVVVPITLQEGRLYLGPVPLLRLAPVL